jgi:hypothetical protein
MELNEILYGDKKNIVEWLNTRSSQNWQTENGLLVNACLYRLMYDSLSQERAIKALESKLNIVNLELFGD